MALPTTNLGMDAIATEFASYSPSQPHGLNEFYGCHANVASSGTISFAQFLGIAGISAYLDSNMYAEDYASSGTATAIFYVNTGGSYSGLPDGSSAVWKDSNPASSFDVRFSPTSGTVSGGDSVDTWHNLGTTRSWYVSQSTSGSKSCVGTLEIRMAASPYTVLASGTLDLFAEKG